MLVSVVLRCKYPISIRGIYSCRPASSPASSSRLSYQHSTGGNTALFDWCGGGNRSVYVHCYNWRPSVDPDGESDCWITTYTFAANNNDKIVLRMGRTTPDVQPQIRLYNSTGTKLCEAYDSYAAVVDLAACAPLSAGTYTVLITAFNSANTGTYNLSFQRVTNPVGAATLTFGQSTMATLSAAAELDVYTFTASAQDTVVLRMGSSTNELYPHIRVYGPTGTKLCEGYRNYSYAADVSGCLLPSTGTYTVLVNTYNSTTTGTYGLIVQRANRPSSALPIELGKHRLGELTTPGELDSYTFTANSGDMMLLRMGSSTSELYPHLRIYGPDGVKLCESYRLYQAAVDIDACLLPSNGNYTILVNAYSSANTGAYGLMLQRLNNPGNAKPLDFGRTETGLLESPGQFATYTFGATANSAVHLRMTSSTSALYPHIRLYSQDGTKLCEAGRSYQSNAEISRCLLPTSGKYTLVATNYNRAGTGSYTISLTCLTESCEWTPRPMEHLFLPFLQK
jgi:hypothetical protein